MEEVTMEAEEEQEEVTEETKVEIEEINVAEEVTEEETSKDSSPENKNDVDEIPEEKGKLVLPGDLVGTSEEFTSRDGTYENRGNIYATTAGIVKVNNKNRSVSVIPVTNIPPVLKEGDIVIGRVHNMRESVALVEIAALKGGSDREIVGDLNAAIHVSNVKDAYVKDLNYEFSAFDIVKAKVIDMRSMRLSTVDKELGVMKAYCGKCRTVLAKDDGNDKLKCPKCERTETRKLSSDYGTGTV